MKMVLKKIVVLTLVLSFVLTCSGKVKVKANDNVGKITDAYEDEKYKISQDDNIITIYDKKLKNEIIMTIENDNEATLKYSSGEVKKIVRKNNNKIYLEDRLVINPTVKRENTDKTKELSATMKANSWHYYQTIYYDTKTKGDIESIALGIFSFCPYIGPVVTIVAIVKTARNMGAKTLYVKVKQYYYTGYSKYKYENYFYSNKARTKLIKHTTTYKKMW